MHGMHTPHGQIYHKRILDIPSRHFVSQSLRHYYVLSLYQGGDGLHVPITPELGVREG